MIDVLKIIRDKVVDVHLAASRFDHTDGVFWLVTAKFGAIEINAIARDLRTATGLALRDLSEKLLKTGEQP